MPDIKILTETELRNTIPLDIKVIDCIESSFSELASVKVIMPTILSMSIKEYLDPQCLKLADLYVADSISQTVKQGELRAALDAKIISSDENFPELGKIINKTEKGRSSSKDITIVDLTGTGAQDTAIATYALKKAVELGAGEIFHN